MTQHDLEWADQNFPPMRVDMNAALTALSTRQAGDGPPALVAAARPNRIYVDITRKQVLARDNADTADFIQDAWAQDRVRLVTISPDAFLPEDVGRLVMVNSPTAVAQSLPEATGLFGPGWNTEVFNLGAGQLTITPVTSQLNGVAGATVLQQYQGARIFSLGGHWWAAMTGRGTVVQADLTAAQVPMGTIAMHIHWGANPAGWVRLQGGSIGRDGSGASERAHQDAYNLYNYLWSLYGQAYIPVAGGRGGTALADFNAYKVMYLFDTRGRALFGIDLGAGRLNGAYGGIPGHIPGAYGGQEWMQLTAAHMAPHTHGYGYTDAVGQGGEGGPYAGLVPRVQANNTDGGAGLYQSPFTVTPPGIAIGGWIVKL